jgi:hypothetical protein
VYQQEEVLKVSCGYSNRIWCCPYFKWDKRQEVHCEGGAVAMTDRGLFLEYIERYCASVDGWQKCTIAQAMTKYYQESGDLPAE